MAEGEFEKLWADKRIVWKKEWDSPKKKVFLSDRVQQGIAPYSIIADSIYLTVAGRKDLEALDMATEPFLGHRVLYFDFPKPVALIKYLMRPFKDDITVLDIFAGSCTTAQAVMEINAEDGGSRNWILMQRPDELPENAVAREIGAETIADVGEERIRRVITKLTDNPTLFNKQDLSYKRLEVKDA